MDKQPHIAKDANIVKLEQEVARLQEQLRISNTKFDLVYDDDPVMHASINPTTGILINCNSTLITNLGYKSKDDVLGSHVSKIYSKNSRLKIAGLLDTFLKTGAINSEELTLKTLQGNKIPVILNSRAIYNEKGVIVKSISTLVDISEIKKAQKKAKKKSDALQRVNIDLEQFVSICSHDLQEPLATIRFSSDFLMQKFAQGLSPKGKEYIGYIHEASGRMAEQIKGLLAHSRIGKDLKKSKVDIQEQLEVVKYDLKKRIEETNATIIAENLPKVKGYKIELRLLLQNLIGNALKYAKNEVPPLVTILAKETDNFWQFSVTDNGIGIKQEDMYDLFTIFTTVPTKDKVAGTGVGLAHAEKIVKLHGGRIWVESQFGQGSTFYFEIKK